MSKKKGRANVEVATPRDTTRVAHRTFPGPVGAAVPLRVAFSRQSYGDLVGHAKESLDAEVCGVLVGEVGLDDEGPFVDVRAIIRGEAARQARAHVTFTHDTWNQIHATLDRDYAGLQIVGWYHTHPGFGVEFSAMDRFIQENFFSGKTQVALLLDPLGGDTALAYNAGGGIDYVTRFWVDGREHSAKSPNTEKTSADSASTSVVAGDGVTRRDLERLEARLGQLVQALDEQRASFHRLLTSVVVVICGAIIAAVGYHIWADRFDRLKPPQTNGFVQIPVKVGNDVVMLGVDVVQWDVPPRLNAMLDKLAKAEIEARERERQELMKQMEKQRPKQQKGAAPAR